MRRHHPLPPPSTSLALVKPAREERRALTALAPTGLEELGRQFTEVSCERVLAWMRRICPYNDFATSYPEIASGFADAATDDPLWPDPGGGARTAALLVAFAYQLSGFHPNLVGKNGQAFGLFQIRVPAPTVDGSVLLLPRSAAYVAIEMIRQALSSPGADDAAVRLLWYQTEPPTPFDRLKSQARLDLAAHLLSEAS